MKKLTQKLKDRLYGKKDHPYAVFEQVVLNNIPPNAVLLDAGCGREAPTLRKLASKCRLPVGIDVQNPVPIEDEKPIGFLLGDLSNMGLRDNSIDIVISRSVLEHVKRPGEVYREIHRVLKLGGIFIFLTPNLYDYASLISKVLPNAFHARVVKMTEGRDDQDTFPTYYRSNSRATIEMTAKSAGFQVRRMSLLGQYPSYMMFNPLLFLVGAAYDKLVCRLECMSFLRGWILCVLQKSLAGRKG